MMWNNLTDFMQTIMILLLLGNSWWQHRRILWLEQTMPEELDDLL